MNKRNFLLPLFALALFSSCKKQAETQAETQADTLAESFIRENGIEFGTPQWVSISDEVQCTAMVDVPPNSRATISSRTDGQVLSIPFIEGDTVRAGSTVAVVSLTGLPEKQKQYHETQARLAFAEKEWKRKQMLYQNQATSQRSLQEAESQAKMLNATMQGLEKEMQQIGASQNSGATIALKSPISGVIAKIYANKGSALSAQSPVLEVLNEDEKHIVVQVPARYATALEIGTAIQTKVGNETLQGSIIKISPEVDAEKRTITVHCHLVDHNREHLLKPNSMLSVTLFLQEKRVLALPKTSLVQEGQLWYVIIKKENSTEKKQIEGATLQGEWIVLPPNYPTHQVHVVKGAYYYQ